jgi:hypothetical protein
MSVTFCFEIKQMNRGWRREPDGIFLAHHQEGKLGCFT